MRREYLRWQSLYARMPNVVRLLEKHASYKGLELKQLLAI